MHYSIRFETSKFDHFEEHGNPAYPVPGRSLLIWLKEKLAGEVPFDDPDQADWGWLTTIRWKGRLYQLGTSAMAVGTEGYEWVFQIDKQRSLREQLAGREPMTRSDECLQFFKSLFESDPEFKYVTIE